MKKLLLNKLWLRVWLLVTVMTTALAGTVWADEVTLVSGSGTSGYAVPDGWTSSGTVAGGQYLKFDDGTITSPEFAPHTGLSFTYTVATFGSGTNHPLTIRILNASTNAVIVEKTTSTPTSSSYISTGSPLSLGDVDVAFKIQLYAPTGKGVRLRNYSIKGTPAGASGLEDNDLALTGAPIALNFDLYNNSSAQVINYTTSSTGAVTIADNDYASFDIDDENQTITVTPIAVTPSAQTITVNQAVDKDYDAGSATFTLTITDSTPIPTHTVTFSVNGVTSTQDFEEGAVVVFPNDPASVDNMVFKGWVSEAIEGTTNEAPIYVTSPIMGQNDVTYYAVFAEQLGSGDPSWTETALADLTASDIFVIVGGGYAMTNDNGTSSAPAAEAITVSAGKLTTPTPVPDNIKWNVTGNATDGYIFYPNGTTETWLYCNTTASTSSNNNMRVGTGNRKVFELNASGYLVTKDNNTTRYLSLYDNQDFRGYINTLNGAFVPVFYKYSSPISYSGYCTSFVVATVARPTIEVADNPFTFSTTATITCETEGAAIKYSYDGENWSNYEGALTITATTTIYAKAVKDETESSVASVTATKNLATPTVTVSGDLTLDLNGETDVNAGALTAAVTYNEAAVEGAVVTWTSSAPDVATIDENTGAVTIKTRGTVTFTAAYAGNSDYAEATGTKQFTVTDSKVPGSAGNPYTVAQARAAIDAGTGVTGVYATGIVSEIVTAFNPTYGNITYNISADGSTEGDQLQAYRGFSYNGDWFESAADIQLGDVVVIYGNLKNYKGTYEFNQENQLVSLVEAATVGSAGYTTYVTRKDVSFPAEVEAYIATTVNGAQEYVTLTQVNSAPKGTALVLKNEGTFTLNPTASPDDVTGNLLLASDGTVTGDESTIFALGKKNDEVGFYLVADGQTVPAGKAYLSVPAAVKGFLAFDFGDIDAIKTVQGAGLKDAAIFNLAGQRMSRMHRGVNLVNGKKIILK